MSAAHRKGWCPGALQPMESGDGLIVRLRIIGGLLVPDLAQALAQCADDYGNGLIDLSSRGNLQLRGVTEATLPALQTRLDALDLLDADPAGEAVRNILASPLAGVDPSALINILPLVKALDERLRSDHILHHLPGKFLFLIDDGGCLPLAPETADMAFVAMSGIDGPFFVVHLAGIPVSCCTVHDLCETAGRLAYAFLHLRGENESAMRMADLTRRIGADMIARTAGLVAIQAVANDPPRVTSKVAGFHALGQYGALGLGVAVGRLDAKTLRLLA
jgi:precorrin-3B synthase